MKKSLNIFGGLPITFCFKWQKELFIEELLKNRLSQSSVHYFMINPGQINIASTTTDKQKDSTLRFVNWAI
jgi:hypothetical protein